MQSQSSIRCKIPGKGMIVDSNLARLISCSCTILSSCAHAEVHFSPLKLFGLQKPHISENCSERALKKRKSWSSHRDATDPDLSFQLNHSIQALFHLATSLHIEPLFEESDKLPDDFHDDFDFHNVGDSDRLYIDPKYHETCSNESLTFVQASEDSGFVKAHLVDDSVFSQRTIELKGQVFVIPGRAKFYLGDIRQAIKFMDNLLAPKHLQLQPVEP
jgi:hypothetical protein